MDKLTKVREKFGIIIRKKWCSNGYNYIFVRCGSSFSVLSGCTLQVERLLYVKISIFWQFFLIFDVFGIHCLYFDEKLVQEIHMKFLIVQLYFSLWYGKTNIMCSPRQRWVYLFFGLRHVHVQVKQISILPWTWVNADLFQQGTDAVFWIISVVTLATFTTSYLVNVLQN